MEARIYFTTIPVSREPIVSYICITTRNAHFPEKDNNDLAEHFMEIDFLIKWSYLCGIFEKLKSLNLSLKEITNFNTGRGVSALEEITSVQKKNIAAVKIVYPFCKSLWLSLTLISLSV